MKIKELFNNKPVISLEIFPPKPSTPIDTIFETIDNLKNIKPDFISVTYGAGGSSRDYTVQIADILKNKYNIETLAHLTCINSSQVELEKIISELKDKNIENILALRGDLPSEDASDINKVYKKYAKDLIKEIKKQETFCVGAACYPEGHIESKSKLSDLKFLKEKVDAGADFLITQLFFNNELFYGFLEELYVMGVSIPVLPGIMPVINKKQIERITKLCGASLPPKFQRILYKYENNPAALKEAGIAYATEQIIDLLSFGVDGIHLYTMNKPEIAEKIFRDISYIRNYLTSELSYTAAEV